jgi:hypothetical protein
MIHLLMLLIVVGRLRVELIEWLPIGPWALNILSDTVNAYRGFKRVLRDVPSYDEPSARAATTQRWRRNLATRDCLQAVPRHEAFVCRSRQSGQIPSATQLSKRSFWRATISRLSHRVRGPGDIRTLPFPLSHGNRGVARRLSACAQI